MLSGYANAGARADRRPGVRRLCAAVRRRASSSRIPGAILLGLVLIPGVGCFSPPPDRPPAPPAEATPFEAPASAAVEIGELRVRLRPGAVVRSGPGTADEAVAWLEDGGLFAVLEATDGAYRIEIPGEDGAAPTSGWVPAGAEGLREVRIARSRLGPQVAPEPDAAALEAASRHLGDGGREWPCGPYRLLTDVSDRAFLDLCTNLAVDLDAAYAERFGLEPAGQARGAVILFRDPADFRAFAEASAGHAGHARASRSYVSLYVGDRTVRTLATTLAHELTHLVNRRALGTPLPRWLSEGLADAIGDPATPTGLGPAAGLGGAEVARRRVLERPDLPNLGELATLDFGQFDGRPDARDYEQSAVFIRFLLSDAERRRAFHAFLRGVAEGESADLDALLGHFEAGGQPGRAEDWDRRLRSWLESSPAER
ncbi:MAG: hypothetical protein AAGF23_17520 [Acidobacteriota bacterium]